MIAIIGIVCCVLLLGVILLLKSSLFTRKPSPVTRSVANHPTGEVRPTGPRASGLD